MMLGNDNSLPNLFVILGMHRSGTSLISAGVSHLGVDFGEHLMKGNQFNQKGYWEDKDIAAFNNRILNNLGLQWDSLEVIPHCHFSTPEFNEFVDEGAVLVASLGI